MGPWYDVCQKFFVVTGPGRPHAPWASRYCNRT